MNDRPSAEPGTTGIRVHDDEAWAIAEGRHGDPFKVLGPQNGQLAVWAPGAVTLELKQGRGKPVQIGRASCRERVCSVV